ncbi:MAG TPA: hypothetical protein VF778_11515, partial [Xanthobacteraceae bacterium]
HKRRSLVTFWANHEGGAQQSQQAAARFTVPRVNFFRFFRACSEGPVRRQSTALEMATCR